MKKQMIFCMMMCAFNNIFSGNELSVLRPTIEEQKAGDIARIAQDRLVLAAIIAEQQSRPMTSADFGNSQKFDMSEREKQSMRKRAAAGRKA